MEQSTAHLPPSEQENAKPAAGYLLAALVDSCDDAIVSKNLNGIITSWNEGARQIFGYTADEIIGQSILRLIPEELHYEEVEIIRKLKAGERITHYETVRVRKNGERFPISVTISPVRDADGKIIGASKIARDISSADVWMRAAFAWRPSSIPRMTPSSAKI